MKFNREIPNQVDWDRPEHVAAQNQARLALGLKARVFRVRQCLNCRVGFKSSDRRLCKDCGGQQAVVLNGVEIIYE